MPDLGTSIAQWMRGQVTAAGARGLVVGLSGGIDSAVVARLSQLAMPGATVAVLLPCASDPQDERDARLVVDHFRLSATTIDLTAPYDALLKVAEGGLEPLRRGAASQPPPDDIRARVPIVNIKPRLRMASLYFIANSLNYLVAGTGNRSELSIGYFTKYGDGGVDLLPLGGLVKSQVRVLARDLDVPGPVVAKAPSAGLWLGQTDEAEMGFSYEDLEAYLTRGPETVAPALALRIERLIRASHHKRALPPVFNPASD